MFVRYKFGSLGELLRSLLDIFSRVSRESSVYNYINHKLYYAGEIILIILNRFLFPPQ